MAKEPAATSVRLDPAEMKRLDEIAEAVGMSRSEIVRRAIHIALPIIENDLMVLLTAGKKPAKKKKR